MIKIKLIFFNLIFFLGILSAVSQEFKTYNFEEFKPLLNKQDDKVYVINFWATWCKPCVEEIPAFNQLFENYKNKNVEIIMVSLDFGASVDQRIKLFKERHQMKARIVILDDPDSNSWINKVSPTWSGAIPATLIYNKTKREFYEQSFHYEELEKELKKFLK
jgi:thiol-disulfide isomerase/thioredoxin